jgi:pilus assembly protein Flp/PilA
MENKAKAEQESRSQRGASMVEYALLVALIAVVAITAVQTLGTQISRQLNSAANAISTN